MTTSNLENAILILLISSLLQSIALVYLCLCLNKLKQGVIEVEIQRENIESANKVKVDTSLKDHEKELNLKGLFKKNGS